MARPRPASMVIARSGDLVVERGRERPSGRLLRQGDMEASYIDLADPRHLEFDYLRWMRIVLRAARTQRVLHVGGAGCALPRALAVENPRGLQQVCEVDAAVLELARRYLGLHRAPGLRVRCVEGRQFVASQGAGSWDAVVIDAFVGARVPTTLISLEALADVSRVAPLALINVLDSRQGYEVAAVAAGLAAVYPRTWTIGGRSGNTVVAGGRRRPFNLDLIAARLAADPAPARLVRDSAMAGIVAGASALRDHDVRDASSA